MSDDTVTFEVTSLCGICNGRLSQKEELAGGKNTGGASRPYWLSTPASVSDDIQGASPHSPRHPRAYGVGFLDETLW